MASEIPADIRATAKAVRDKLCIDCECTFDRGCGCLDALHEALLAERQAQQTRAVAILSGIGDILARHITDSATPDLLDAIATAIRQDKPNETEQGNG